MTPSRGFRLALLAAFACQIPLLVVSARANQHLLNQDATFFLRYAIYYLTGRLNLAVTGWFGPLFSWMLTPLLLTLKDPLTAARVAMSISAVVFLLGTVQLLRTLRLPAVWVVLGVWISMLATIYWSVMVIMPDLLYGGIILFAISEMLSDRWVEGWRSPVSAGVWAGLSYLTKPVGFPVSIALVLVAASLWIVSGSAEKRAALRGAGLTLAAFLLVSAPWVVALSAKYGGVTITTAARANRAIVSPPAVNRNYQAALRRPDPGQFAWGEDPSDMFRNVPGWSPFESWAYAKYQIRLTLASLARITEFISNLDTFHFGVVALLWGFLIHTPWRERMRTDRWRWSGAVAGCVCLPYVPLFAGELRYYLPVFPLAFAASAGMVTALANPASGRQALPWLTGLVLILFSFVDGQRANLMTALGGLNDPVSAHAVDLAARLRARGIHGSIAGAGDYSSSWSGEYVGVYLAFLLDEPFYGSDPHPTATAFKASGAQLVVVERQAAVVSELTADPDFLDLDARLFASRSDADHYPLKVFQVGASR